ncbi:MAG: TIR domain-containing protein [Pseudonocardiaceae bacterium]
MAHIFISYASPDRPVADEVLGWLRAAGHEAFLDDDLRNRDRRRRGLGATPIPRAAAGRRGGRGGDVVVCGVELVLG